MGIDEALALVMGPDLCGGEVAPGGTVRLHWRVMILKQALPRSSLANRFRLRLTFARMIERTRCNITLWTTSLIN